MRRLLVTAASALVALAFCRTTAWAGPGPSGSDYSDSSWGYGVQCASGDAIPVPGDVNAFVYNGSGGTELCVEQRDADGNETGPVSARVWATPDGAHVDAPGAGNPSLGDRVELDVTDGYVRLSSHWTAGEPLHQETTLSPLEGRIHREAYGSDYGYYSSVSDTWVDGDGLHSESSYYDYYGSGSTQHSVGLDGAHYSSHNDSAYYGEAENVDGDVGGDGVYASRSQVGGDTFSSVVVSISPSGGIVLMSYESGFNGCGDYGAAQRGVTWDIVGDPGSLPTVVDSDDRPPCS